MSKLHVFIDGSWLFKSCRADGVLACKTEYSERSFRMDFGKLSDALLDWAKKQDKACVELGDRYLATSVFTLPDDFDSWPDDYDDITLADIETTRRNVDARNSFAKAAVECGFSDEAVHRPRMKGFIVRKLKSKRYQEKQVDTSVVALLVRSAIVNPYDYHVVITGDADILPAIKVAYPEYSKNVFVATTHPDELRAEHRQTAWSLSNFDFTIDPFYLQDHTCEIMFGTHVYECAHCHLTFSRTKAIPRTARPCCRICHAKRT